MSEAESILAGVALGWLLSTITEWIRRRWARADAHRERAIERAEEVLALGSELFQWSEDATRAALLGERVPIQRPIYRVVAIVEMYFPSLSQKAKALDEATTTFRARVIQLHNMIKLKKHPTDEFNGAFEQEREAFKNAVRALLFAALSAIKPKIQ